MMRGVTCVDVARRSSVQRCSPRVRSDRGLSMRESAAPDKSAVSVVVPAYGVRSGALARALRSVHENEPHVELIVVDDGTPDGSVADLCSNFGSVRYVRSATNGGVAAAQNMGIDAAAGEHICFLHSDDEYVAGRLDAQLSAARNEPGAVIGGASAYDDRIAADPLPSASVDDFVMHRFGVHISPYLFPASTLAVTRFDPRLRSWEDWDLLFRLVVQGQAFVATNGIVARIREDAADRVSELIRTR